VAKIASLEATVSAQQAQLAPQKMIQQLHGSGTTNPSRLFWQSMDIIEERTKGPVHLTYRAVGSSTGQKEFLGASNGNMALNHFGSGDIPMTNARYSSVVGAGRTMVHVPFALGAIGLFHSVPSSELPTSGSIHLTGCVLAKIMSTQITTWNDAEIVALNPGMTATGTIKVVHRVEGSSSTAGFTEYLSGKCPASWTLGSGSTITWPSSTFTAQGSGGMSSFIQANSYAIGYIDAGHGHAASLGEIALQNLDGVYLRTTEANIGAAGTAGLAAGVIPTDPTADFSAVNLYDQAGNTTWPITMISYFYMNKDLSSLDVNSAALLMYFVEFILSTVGQDMAVTNLFSRLPAELLTYNQQTLSTLMLPTGYTPYTTELASTTQVEVGAGAMVVSGKRRSYAEYERTANVAKIASLEATVSPPPPVVHSARVEISAAGSVADVTEADKAEIASAIAASAGVSPSSVSVTVVSASVRIIAEVITASADEASSAMAKLQQDMSTPEATTAMLSSASIEVITVPAVTTVATSEPSQSTPPPSPSVEALLQSDEERDNDTRDLAFVALGIGIAGCFMGFLAFAFVLCNKNNLGKPVQREVSFPKAPSVSSTAEPHGVELKREVV